jgi:hypothetical protein
MERSPSNSIWEAFIQASALVYRGGNSPIRNQISVVGMSGQWFSWLITDNGSGTGASNGSAMYLNGKPQAANGTSGNVGPPASGNVVHLGNYDGTGFPLDGQHSWAAIWNYPLSAQMAGAIGNSPNAIWQMFQSPQLVYRTASAAPSFKPWIYGDQVEEMYG